MNSLADKLFYERHPDLRGVNIQLNEMALTQEWREIRRCDAVVDFLFYERHPQLAGRNIIKSEIDLIREWNQIKRTLRGCN